MATLRTAIHLLLTYLLSVARAHAASNIGIGLVIAGALSVCDSLASEYSINFNALSLNSLFVSHIRVISTH